MIDTNVIISALLKHDSVPSIVLNNVCANHKLVLCDHIINESYDVAKRRFPDKIDALDDLFTQLRYKLVFAPGNGKIKIRDIKDQPILNAAIDFAIDILITGDKHFLELNLKNLQIITPSEYKKQYIP